MSDKDDLVEFGELAKASPPARKGRARNGTTAPSPSTPKGALDEQPEYTEEELDEDKVGCCQYARIGPGFIPTGATVKRLRPGIYYIEETPQGSLILVQHKLTTDDLLRLPDSKSDEVISEIEHFWTLKERFRKFGFSHKRGFLLWGPPGSGKTATVTQIATGMVKRGGIVVVSWVPPHLTHILPKVRQAEPERPCVVIIEDIDTVIQNYGESNTLALLDGENSIDNVVFLATTNYPENLDGRIINRPSRFDKICKIGMPNAAARRTYIESRKVGLSEEELERWVQGTKDLSIAHIKELIIGVQCFGNKLEDELDRLQAMKYSPKSGDADGKNTAGFR